MKADKVKEATPGDLKYYKPPFEFREPKTDNEGPLIYDAEGHQMTMLFWPTHPVEETGAAEQETYRLGRAMAASWEMLQALEAIVEDYEYRGGKTVEVLAKFIEQAEACIA